jgi:hypothetical protein
MVRDGKTPKCCPLKSGLKGSQNGKSDAQKPDGPELINWKDHAVPIEGNKNC